MKLGNPRSLVKKPPEESSPESPFCSITAVGVVELDPFAGESMTSEAGAVVKVGDDGNLFGSCAKQKEIALRPIPTEAT
jgi:hypothetical protein